MRRESRHYGRQPQDRLTIGSLSELPEADHLRIPPKTTARFRKDLESGSTPDWASLDWRLGNRYLASVCGCSEEYIRDKRLKYAPGSGPAPLRDAWEDVDWSLSDSEIAGKMGLAVEAVAARRRRVAIGPITRDPPLRRFGRPRKPKVE